jgi:hypothetical protein
VSNTNRIFFTFWADFACLSQVQFLFFGQDINHCARLFFQNLPNQRSNWDESLKEGNAVQCATLQADAEQRVKKADRVFSKHGAER